MQSFHAAAAVVVAFDDPNLIADAGLVPIVALAERIGLPDLVSDRVKIVGARTSGGADPAAKVMSVLAGMVAGADSITDTDRLRHAGMGIAFGGSGARASPTTSRPVPRWRNPLTLLHHLPLRRAPHQHPQ